MRFKPGFLLRALLALMIVLSFSMITALPAAAAGDLTWGDTTFLETLPANDGSITTVSSLTLSTDNFTVSSGVMTVDTHYTVANVPAGLTVVVTGTTLTTGTVALTGNAAAHNAADNIANLTITFQDAAFTGGDAAAVTNYSRNDLAVTFYDPNTLTWNTTTFLETLPANDGSITTTSTLTLTGDTFVITGGAMTDPTHYNVANVPAGLTVAITGTSGTTATVALTGNAAAHAAAESTANLTITFTNDAFTGADASNVVDSSRNNLVVTFYDPNTLSWGATTFLETMPANDGTITTTSALTLTGDTFVITGGAMTDTVHYTVANVPAGLTVAVTGTSGTTATVALTGNAAAHAAANSIANLTITFTNDAFTGADASNVVDSSRNNLVVTFYDPTVMAWSATTFLETMPANNGTITTTSTLTLTSETFVITGGAMTDSTHYTVANVPAGLTVVITGTSTTTATVALTGNAAAHAAADSIANLTITFLDAAFTGGSAAAVADSSKNDLVVTFYTPPADLTALMENLAANLNPAFAAGVYTYTLAASNAEASLILTATLAGATITYYPATLAEVVASGVSKVIALNVGTNTITIQVTKAGYSATNYTITVTRAAEYVPFIPTPSPTPTPVPEPAPVSLVLSGLTGSTLLIDSKGVTTAEGTFTTNKGDVTLTILAGTKMVKTHGAPLNTITARPMTTFPTPPPSGTIVLAYDFGPDGASFDPPISLTIPFDKTAGEDVSIAYWDGTQWNILDTTIDPVTGHLTAKISHFTTFAVITFAEDIKPVPTVPTVTPEPTLTPTAEPEPTVTAMVPEADEGGLQWWMIALIGLATVIVLFFVVRYGWNMGRN